MRQAYLLALTLLFTSSHGLASEKANEQEAKPPRKGNFVLPPSQQPGPLVSLGMNIIEKYQTQAYFGVNSFMEKRNHFVDISPSFLWGINDKASLLTLLPVAVSYKEGKHRSSGVEDATFQGEYALYSDSTTQFEEQASVVANMTFPTGSTRKNPPTGYGSSSFMGAATYNRMYEKWFGFTAHGLILTTTHHGTKFGNAYLYQLGLGRNIASCPSRWMWAALVEVDGQYAQQDKRHGQKDHDSGGNVIYMTPSLWFSTQKMIVQVGFGVPIAQHLFGDQSKVNYLTTASLGWTF